MIHQELLIPALRAKMGDWTYYIASMTLEEFTQRVTTASAFHKSNHLNELIQRSLKGSRERDIAEYLRSQPQRLFGALVVGVYGGEPEWLEVEFKEDARPWDNGNERLDGAIGLLRLSGSEQLFALDGQHRMVGTERALMTDPSLGKDEVAVIFVGHSTEPAGLKRTRRLFSTLNRYAKPVSKRDIIALDEDDAVAIVTRRLVDSHSLFLDRVALGKTKSVPSADTTNFTSIVALYDCVEMVLKLNPVWKSGHKKIRPNEETLKVLTQHCEDYWNNMVDEHDVLRAYVEEPRENNPAQGLRGRRGGHMLFRPIGILVHTRVATLLCANEETDTREAIRRLTRVPLELSEAPWPGLLWDRENQRMITSPEAQRVAKWLIYRSVGGSLRHLKTDEAKLRKELAGLLNKAPEDVELPQYAA